MRTIQTTIYQFSELSDEAKEKARDRVTAREFCEAITTAAVWAAPLILYFWSMNP